MSFHSVQNYLGENLDEKMTESDRTRRPKNFGRQIPKKLLIFSGDCRPINDFLETKSEKSIFGFLQYLNALLRSFGHVIFANNPISGFIIIIAIGSTSYKAMFAALFTSSLSYLFAKLIQQDILGNLNGFFSYNAVLHAVVSVGYLPQKYESLSLDEPRFWLLLFFVTLISVYFTSAFANLFRYLWHYPIPCFTLPFNILQYILIFCLLNNAIPPRVLSSHLLEPAIKQSGNDSLDLLLTTVRNKTLTINTSFSFVNDSLRKKRKINGDSDLGYDQDWFNNSEIDNVLTLGENSLKNDSFSDETHLNWGETFAGTITALSQVYGLNNVPCSILMFLALIIYSPTTALFCYTGSFVGTVLGIFLAPDYERVYSGVWGYNGMLCGGALAGFGFVLTAQSAFLAFVAVLFSTVFQHFITPLFETINVPIFHIPFLVTTVIFLLVNTETEKALPRPGNYTYPEKHRREFKNQYKNHLEGCLARGEACDNLSS